MALGWERRAIDAIFRELDVVFLPASRARSRRSGWRGSASAS